jgi:hypothetical protein
MRTTQEARLVVGVLASALAISVGVDAATASTPAPEDSLGARDLKLGDQGGDVKTLNWVLRAQALSTAYHGTFDGQTDWAVRTLQGGAGLRTDGVVRRDTRKAIAARMLNQRATWYGPGFYGNRTACGKRLTKETIGVAHRTLPCGTRVAFAYRGRWVRAKVIDRGPYRKGHKWDLTSALAKRLGAIKAGSARLKAGVAP